MLWRRQFIRVAAVLLGAVLVLGAAHLSTSPAHAASNGDEIPPLVIDPNLGINLPPLDGPAAPPADPQPKPRPGKKPSSPRGKTKPAPKQRKPDPAPAQDNPDSAGYVGGGSQSSSPERDKLIESLKPKLAEKKGKLTPDDYFAIGTVSIVDHKVEVAYWTMQGENATAAKLADFLLAQPKGVREWRMIGRVKTQAAAEKLLAAARAKSIEAQLAAFPVTPKREKKSPEDAYVVGTAEITGYHADVRFQVVLGTKPSADFLIEYTMTGEKGSKRMWHVFTRAKTEAEATRYVEQLRRDYDMLDSQRQAVAQAYNVRTTRRC